MRLQGVLTALITPFKEGSIDEEGLRSLIQWQIQQGINGLVLLGTTGEAATQTPDEQQRVIEIAVQEAHGRVPIVVGTSHNCTRETIERTQRAKAAGADAALITAPYYNKPSQEGLYRHFAAIAAETDMPLVVYNIPGRTSVNIEVSTLLRLAALPQVVAIKESTGMIGFVGDLIAGLAECGLTTTILAGDDAMTLPSMALGAHGVVSVMSNLIPLQMLRLVQACATGHVEQARLTHHYLNPLFKAAFVETNPVPIKQAMAMCGLPAGGVRLPLCELTAASYRTLREILHQMNLITGV